MIINCNAYKPARQCILAKECLCKENRSALPRLLRGNMLSWDLTVIFHLKIGLVMFLHNSKNVQDTGEPSSDNKQLLPLSLHLKTIEVCYFMLSELSTKFSLICALIFWLLFLYVLFGIKLAITQCEVFSFSSWAYFPSYEWETFKKDVRLNNTAACYFCGQRILVHDFGI